METTLYDSVGYALKKLLFEDPYYAIFMTSLDKQETTRVPTLAVGLNGVNVTLLINKDFWFGLTPQERLGVCKHEILHLVFMHLTTSERYPLHTLDNIATDLEINQYIKPEWLPKGGLTLSWAKETFGVNLEPKRGRDYYYKELLNTIPQDFNLGSAEHFWEAFDKLSEAEKYVVQNQINSIMNTASDTMEAMQPGSTPGEIKALIKLHKIPPRFDWKKYLRLWVGNSKTPQIKQTRFKPNPYFTENPMVKVKHKQNILCAIDTSGSVSDGELGEFMSEIYNLWKSGNTITILCVDTKIYDPYEYRGQSEIKIHGRGGTYFTPTLDYFNSKKEYDCMIYFTDGEAELPPKAIKPMLWVISSKGKTEYIKEHNGKILCIDK